MKSFRCYAGLVFFAIFLFFTGLLIGCGQEEAEKTTAEPSREVPEMDAFVEAFKMIWSAANNDDYQTIRDSAGVIQTAGEKLTQATLPEFHQDLERHKIDRQSALMGNLEKKGISGTAVIPNIKADQEWARYISDIEKRLHAELVSLRSKLPV